MIYLASPYTSDSPTTMERRFRQAAAATAALINRGKIIYSPILHFHPLAELYDLPKNFDFWREVNLNMLSLASELWVLTIEGWRESHGVQAEIAFAHERSIPVNYISSEIWKI
jgi:hypothetical protein